MKTGPPHPPEPLLAHALDWRARLHDLASGRSIQGRLIRNFSLAILITALVTTIVGVGMIRKLVFAQAQAQVNSDLEAAKEIYQSTLDRLEDALRIHATRMVIYGALQRGDTAGLAEEMDRIRQAEHLDVLALAGTDGRVLFQADGPATATEPTQDRIAQHALRGKAPVASTEVAPPPNCSSKDPRSRDRPRWCLRPRRAPGPARPSGCRTA